MQKMHTNKAMLTVLGNLEDFCPVSLSPGLLKWFLKKGGPWTPVTVMQTTHKLYVDSEMVCVKTLYNYVDSMLLALRNIDLPLKVRRRKRRHNVKECLKHLGRSIDERPTEITDRSEFGHWEIDTVVGSKSKSDNVILTLVERLTRKYIAIKIEGKTTSSVSKAMEYLKITMAISLARYSKL